MPQDAFAEGSPSGAADGPTAVRKVYDQMEILETARQALLSRKPFSLKTQIFIANGLVFVLVLGVAWALISNIYRIQSRLQFLEFVNELAVQSMNVYL